MLVRITTSNDRNGNPRRGWLFVNRLGEPSGWVEEEYYGERGALEAWGVESEPITPAIKVTPSEYRRLRTLGQEAGE